MFQLSGIELALRLEHRHEDGSWARLEPRPSPHDPAELDPERHWDHGRIYVCPSCNEEIRVSEASGEAGPAGP
jgi:hypothetical protein